MKSTKPSAFALDASDRGRADRVQSSSIVGWSNLMRDLVPRITVFILALAVPTITTRPARAQTTTPPNCTASSDAASQCFVANAVTTGLTQSRYGMTLAQFHAYAAAVTKILQIDQTYLVMVGLSSAIADALPPTNADGTYNTSAQDAAIAQIVAAAATNGFVWQPPAPTCKIFSGSCRIRSPR